MGNTSDTKDRWGIDPGTAKMNSLDITDLSLPRLSVQADGERKKH